MMPALPGNDRDLRYTSVQPIPVQAAKNKAQGLRKLPFHGPKRLLLKQTSLCSRHRVLNQAWVLKLTQRWNTWTVLIWEDEYEILILFIRLFCHLLPPTGRQAVVNTKGWKHRSQGNCQLRIIQSHWVSSKLRNSYPHAILFIMAHKGPAREHSHCVGTRWQSLFTKIPLDSRHYFKYFSHL